MEEVVINIDLDNQLNELGFRKNTKVINGFRPHFRKNNDLLFIIGADFWLKKIGNIGEAYENYEGNVYGVLTDRAPGLAYGDWITQKKLTLLRMNPLSKGKWASDGMSVEFVDTAV
jgi:hypothetical protein